MKEIRCLRFLTCKMQRHHRVASEVPSHHPLGTQVKEHKL